MAKNIAEIPYTELQERILDLGRSADNTKRKVRGIIQDTYVREIPSKFDWNFLIVSSSLTTFAESKAGTVSIDTGDTSLDFSGASIDSSMTGRKIKISGNDVVYDFTFVNDSTGTISPSFEGNANASGNSYTIYQPVYALAQDFDRFPKNGGIYRWQGGRKEALREEPYQEYVSNFQPTPTANPKKVRPVGTDTAGAPLYEFRPAPNNARNYGYDYIRELPPLQETSAGTVTITATDTTITGNSTLFTEATTGDWFRVSDFGTGQDSTWYRVIAIVNDTTLTLSQAFANSGVTSANYVVSSAPEMPTRLHPGVLHGSLRNILFDQNDENFQFQHIKYAEVLSDSKRIHVSRVYDQKVPTIAEDYLYRR